MPRVAKAVEENVMPNSVAAVPGDQNVVLEIPISEPHTAAFPIHIELQLDAVLGMTLRRIARGYDRQQATLKNGRRVVDATTAVRKLIETVAESIDQ